MEARTLDRATKDSAAVAGGARTPSPFAGARLRYKGRTQERSESVTLCSVPGYSNAYGARGYCKAYYMRGNILEYRVNNISRLYPPADQKHTYVPRDTSSRNAILESDIVHEQMLPLQNLTSRCPCKLFGILIREFFLGKYRIEHVVGQYKSLIEAGAHRHPRNHNRPVSRDVEHRDRTKVDDEYIA